MRKHILSILALINVILLVSPAQAENSIEIKNVRLGVGVGIAQVTARVPGQPKYSANNARFSANIGYALTPVWEAGVIFSGGKSKTASNGINSLNIKTPALSQLYVRGRQFGAGKLGAYGMMTLGVMRQKAVNITTGRSYADNFMALGFGAGLSWKLAPKYIVDAGLYVPGLPLSTRKSGLNVSAPGLMVSLNYALGDDQPERPVEEVAEVYEPEPVDLRKIEPEPLQQQVPEPEPQVFKVAEQAEVEPVIEEVPQQPKEEIVHVIHLEGVYFAFNEHTLDVESKAVLQRIVGELNTYPYSRIEIVAYTDNLGGDLYNLQLSIRRAKTVKAYLIELGIEASRLSSKGYGSNLPVADNSTEEGRAKNRRAELQVID